MTERPKGRHSAPDTAAADLGIAAAVPGWLDKAFESATRILADLEQQQAAYALQAAGAHAELQGQLNEASSAAIASIERWQRLLLDFSAQAELATKEWERLEREWEATLARLSAIGIRREDVVSVFEGWEEALFSEQSSLVAVRLLNAYRQLLPVARQYVEACDQAGEQELDFEWLRSRVAALEAEAASTLHRKPFSFVQEWPGLGDRAVRLYELILPHVKPRRRQALGRRAPVFVREALSLTVTTINAYPDFSPVKVSLLAVCAPAAQSRASAAAARRGPEGSCSSQRCSTGPRYPSASLRWIASAPSSVSTSGLAVPREWRRLRLRKDRSCPMDCRRTID